MEKTTPGAGFREHLPSFPDKTTLLKITLVVLGLLSIAAALTLGGWGEQLLPHAFTFNYQIITGAVLGTVGLSFSLGVLAWQIAHPTLKETPAPLPPLWEVTLGEGTNPAWLVRREFTDQSGLRTEVFVYGEEEWTADAIENGLDNLLSKTDATITVFWQNYIYKSRVKLLLCIQESPTGEFIVHGAGLTRNASGEPNVYQCSKEKRTFGDKFDSSLGSLVIFDGGKSLLIISHCKK